MNMDLDHLPDGFPFTREELAELMEKDAAAKEIRKKWVTRLTAGKLETPEAAIPYLLYVPVGVPAHLPLVVFLHGLGGCGRDNLGQLLDNDALIDWIKAQDTGMLEPCYVLAPQCPPEIPNGRWEYPYLQTVEKIVDQLVSRYQMDASRLYLTGLSLGGFGAWNLNRMYPERYAAVVSCCPACVKGMGETQQILDQELSKCVPALIHKPLWMFHSEDDFAVPVEVTKRMVRHLEEQGKTDLMLTIYPKEAQYNHGCWEPAYKTAEMFRWLSEQKLTENLQKEANP